MGNLPGPAAASWGRLSFSTHAWGPWPAQELGRASPSPARLNAVLTGPDGNVPGRLD